MASVADDDAVIWARPEVTGRGRTPSFSRSQIAEAAVQIADRDGIAAVTMRRVAAEVGAGTMTLYRYVRSKHELYALMVDAVLDEQQPPAPPEWRQALRQFGHGVRALVHEHPWFPSVQGSYIAPSPRMVAGLEFMLGAIDGIGLDIDEMLEVVMTIMTLAMGFAQDEMAEASAMLHSGLNREQWRQKQAPYIFSLIDTGEHLYLRRLVIDAKIPHLGPDAVFDRVLNRVIAGIAATLPRGKDPLA